MEMTKMENLNKWYSLSRSDEEIEGSDTMPMRGKKYQIGWMGNIEISTISNMEGSSIETFSFSYDI